VGMRERKRERERERERQPGFLTRNTHTHPTENKRNMTPNHTSPIYLHK
jgi:hypothetical protein